MLIYTDAGGVVLEHDGKRFTIPHNELQAVHQALSTDMCTDGNPYTVPCMCVRYGANCATELTAAKPA